MSKREHVRACACEIPMVLPSFFAFKTVRECLAVSLTLLDAAISIRVFLFARVSDSSSAVELSDSSSAESSAMCLLRTGLRTGLVTGLRDGGLAKSPPEALSSSSLDEPTDRGHACVREDRVCVRCCTGTCTGRRPFHRRIAIAFVVCAGRRH